MIKTRLATNNDMEGFLSLQERNLYSNLNELERKDGFVTIPFTVDQLEEIIEQNGLFIALNDENSVVAYAFAGSWEYFEQWEIFSFMSSRLGVLSLNGITITIENSFLYGPVCIDKNYRGIGILNQIFEEMRLEYLKKHPISITFINKINAISKNAHVNKLGWKIINEFDYNNNTYLELAFDMKNSVIEK